MYGSSRLCLVGSSTEMAWISYKLDHIISVNTLQSTAHIIWNPSAEHTLKPLEDFKLEAQEEESSESTTRTSDAECDEDAAVVEARETRSVAASRESGSVSLVLWLRSSMSSSQSCAFKRSAVRRVLIKISKHHCERNDNKFLTRIQKYNNKHLKFTVLFNQIICIKCKK